MRLLHATLPLLLAALAGSSLGASDVRFGVQAALAIPQGDLSDGANLGLQVGGHGRWDFGSGHGLMGRADFTTYGTRHDFTATDLGFGADYTYHVDHNRRGLYFLGGVSFQNYDMKLSGHTESYSGLGIDLGIGFDVDRNLGFQTRLTTHNLDSTVFTSLNLGVTYTF